MQSVVWTSSQNQIECWKSLALHRPNSNTSILVITPSPKLADIRRKKLQEWSKIGAFDNCFEVITISKFLSDFLEKSEDINKYNIFRKSDITLHLAYIYHKKFPHLSYQNFISGYKWFSEIRSYTVDSDLISSVLESVPEEISRAIKIFQFYFENNNIVDEHQALSILTNNVEFYFSKNEHLIMSDFVNMTGQQVDLINKVAKITTVSVIIPSAFKDFRNGTDWVSWLENQSIQGAVERAIDSELQYSNNKFLLYSPGDLQGQLHSFLQGNQFDNILLIGENEDFKNHFLPLSQYFYKNSIDIFNGSKALIFEQLDYEMTGCKLSLAEFKNNIEIKTSAILKNKTGLYREIKILQLLMSVILKIEELTSELVVDDFILSLFDDIVKLDLPRVGLLPLFLNDKVGHLQDFKTLDFRPNSQNFIFFSDKFNGGSSMNELPFPIYEKLASIGPIKNKNLELGRFISELEVVTEGKNTILIPDEFKKNSPVLKMLINGPLFKKSTFEKFEKNDVEKSIFYDPLGGLSKKYFEHQKLNKTSLSFSEVKTFRECPRKYFFKFVTKFDQEILGNNDLKSQHLGIIEHLAIQEYFKNNKEVNLDEDRFYKTCDNLLDEYTKDKKIKLSQSQKLIYLKEIYHYSLNAILVIKGLSLELLDFEVLFEVPINLKTEAYQFRGRIDCLIKSKTCNLILDFKRSAIPSKTEIAELEEIQVISYCAALEKENERGVEGFSYFSLADNENNIFLFNSDFPLMVEGIEVKKFGQPKEEIFKKLEIILTSVAHKINSENEFAPTPSQKSCQFCFLSSLCSRGMS